MAGHDNVIPFPSTPRPFDPPDARTFAGALIDEAGGPHAALTLLQHWTADHAAFSPVFPARPRPTLLARRPDRVAYTVRVELDGARPPIWRRLRLASDLPLDRVHAILQVSIGWTDSHLHHFKAGPDRKDFQMMPFLTPFDVEEGEDEEEGILESPADPHGVREEVPRGRPRPAGARGRTPPGGHCRPEGAFGSGVG